MEVFEAIVGGEYVAVVDAYMRAIAVGDETALPCVGGEVNINDAGLGGDELQQAMEVLLDIGFGEEQLEEGEVRVTALGLVCLLATEEDVVNAIMWHNVYYKLGLVKDMSVVSISCEGEKVDELQRVDDILKARGLDNLIELQYGIYNNLPPF